MSFTEDTETAGSRTTNIPLQGEILQKDIQNSAIQPAIERFLELNTPGEPLCELDSISSLAQRQWEAVNKHFHEEILSKSLPTQGPGGGSAYEVEALRAEETLLGKAGKVKVEVER